MNTFSSGYTFKGSFDYTKSMVEDALVNYFNSDKSKKFINESHWAEQTLRTIEEFTMRPAKRIRGVICIEAYRAFSGKDIKGLDAALKAAVAMELTQSYLLIVDDVMDRSDTRRGGPTLQNIFGDTTDACIEGVVKIDHQANMVAVNVGIIAGHLGMDVLSSIEGLGEGRVERSVHEFNRQILATAYGQMDDFYDKEKWQLSSPEESIIKMYKLKSSRYTIAAPMLLGATLAGATDVRKAILEYALPAGIAFQLRDDLLGIFADTASTGKPNIDDLREGKVTVLMRHAHRHATGSKLKSLQAMFGKLNPTAEDLDLVRKLLVDTGSKSYVESLIIKYSKESMAALERNSTIFPIELREFLQSLNHYLIIRGS